MTKAENIAKVANMQECPVHIVVSLTIKFDVEAV